MATLFANSRDLAAGTYNVASSDGLLLCDVTNGPVYLNMPPTSGMRKGDSFLVKHHGGDINQNNIFLNADAVGKIDGQDNFSLYAQGQAVWVIWTGTTYIIGSVQ